MNDLISVIVPVYNVEAYLRRCIDSILAQTYVNLEIILVDDGSTDMCGAICDEYAEKDDRIKVIHKENGGLSDARNAGLNAFTGKYVTFIDSDDWIEKEFIGYLHQLIVDNNADLSVCDFNYIDSNGKIFNSPETDGKVLVWTQKEAVKMLLSGRKMETSSTGKLYKSRFFTTLEFRFPFGRLFEDIPVTYDVLLNANIICFGNRALYNYFYRVGSISTMSFSPNRLHSVEHLEQSIKKVVQKYPDLVEEGKIAVFRMNFGIVPSFDVAEENKKYRDQVWHNIKRTRLRVIFSTETKIKWKIKAMTTFLGASFVKRIFSK